MKKTKVFLLMLFIGCALFLTSNFVLETDYLWHIKAGEFMFKNGPITHDVFSWILYGKYWMSHEWLFEVILYCLKIIFGNYHLIIYPFITTLLILLIMYIPNRDKFSKNIFYSLLYIVFLVFIMLEYIQARPHLLGFLFFTLTLFILFDLYKNENSKKIFFLPLITIFWSNAHGGSSNLSYILCFIFLFCGLFKFKYKKIEADRFSEKQLIKYFAIALLCMGAICINIHGVKMLAYPYLNMADTVMIKNISEWQPTSLSVLYHYVYYIFVVIMIVSMLLSSKKIKFFDLIIFAFVVFLGLKSIRFWLYTPIVMSFIIFDYVKKIDIDNVSLSIFSVLACGLIMFSIYNLTTFNFKNKISLNKEVVEIIKKENPKRLFNMYNYGGELIYNDIKVFVDGRADLYSGNNYVDYLNIANGASDYVKLIAKYDFDYLLIDKKYPIYTYLKYNEDYEVLYKNNKLVLYKKIVN